MRPFKPSDWMSYCGAERLRDGSEPLIGQYGPLVVIIDRNGLQAFVEEYEDEAVFLEADDVSYLTDVAEEVLAEARGKTPKQILKYLESSF